MVEQEAFDFSLEPSQSSEPHSQSGESNQDEPTGRWESYSLSILSIFFENC